MDIGYIAKQTIESYGYFIFALTPPDFNVGAIKEICECLESQPRIDSSKIVLDKMVDLSRSEVDVLHNCWEPVTYSSNGNLMCPTAFHMKYTWELRQSEYLVNLFASIYNVNRSELQVDIDTVSARLPSAGTREGCFWESNPKEWTTELTSIKGKLALTDIKLYFVTGTNNIYFRDTFIQVYSDIQYGNITRINTKNDPWKLNEREIEVTVPAGSVILWDSRLLRNTYPNCNNFIEFSVNISYSLRSTSKVNIYQRVKSYLTGQAPEILPTGIRYSYMPETWFRFPKKAGLYQKRLPDKFKNYRIAGDGQKLAHIKEPIIANYQPYTLSELGYNLLWGKSNQPTIEDLDILI